MNMFSKKNPTLSFKTISSFFKRRTIEVVGKIISRKKVELNAFFYNYVFLSDIV